MGDFNADPDKLNDLLLNNKTPSIKYQLITKLKNKNFYETYRQCHKENQRNFTWSNSLYKSRIDLIYYDNNFFTQFIYSNIIKPIIYRSDHRITISYFHNIKFLPEAQQRIQQSKRKLFNFNIMDNKKWNLFKSSTSDYYKKNGLKKYKDLIPSEKNINIL